MLSLRIKPITNPKNAVKYYFSKDNYYYTGELSTQWLGVSSDKLNLKGEVDETALENVLSGLLPNGEIIGLKSQSGEIKHRCGYDLTISAPKSVSYLALVAGEKEFIYLHQRAVQKVLGLIEQHAAEARKSGKDGVEYEKTGNLCFASILHDTSREQDPHMHSHALMMNLTERCDGKWRALASDLSRNHGTMEWVMDHQIFLGLVYRSEIALGLKEMGLETEQTGDAHGLFEIKHFSQPLLDKLSKRRTQIENQVETMHSDSLKAYDRATQDTRQAKSATDPLALRERWRSESLSLGIEPSTYLEALKQQTKAHVDTALEHSYEPGQAVQYAIAHLEEKKLAFSYQDILQTSLYFSMGSQGIDGLIQQLDGEVRAHRLVAIDDEDKRFTTPGLIAKERLLMEQLSTFKSQKGVPRDVERMISLTHNESIQQAVMDALCNTSGVVRIQQSSATSRDVLKTLMDYADDSKKIRILSPSSITAHRINQDMKSTPQSLWQWIAAIGKPGVAETVAGFNHQHKDDHALPFFKKRRGCELIIVDESQRLSPDDMNTLLTIADRRAAKVVLLEKPDGLAGFKSDIPGLLDKAAVKTFLADDKPKRTAAIHLVEVSEKEARVMKTAEHFASLSEHERNNTRVLTVSKAEVNDVNAAIRAQLKERGLIGTEEKTVKTLTRITLTESEKKFAKSYQPDWILMQSTRHETNALTIIAVHEKDDRLTVKDRDGVMSYVMAKDIGKSTIVYEQTPLSLCLGDQLMATGNRASEGIKAGMHYDVAGLSRFGIKLKQGKKTLHIPLDDEAHLPFTHAYATTIYATDFKPVEHTLLTLPAYALRKNTLAMVAESSRESLVIVTDDVQKAERYASKISSHASAISLTLESAADLHGLKVINDETTADLLNTLDQALSLLTADKPIKTESEKALKFAIAHLSEREAAFSSIELLEVAIQRAIGRVGVDTLYSTLDELKNKGDLIAASSGILTTEDALNLETSIIATVKEGMHAVEPFLSPEEASLKLASVTLTPGQKSACQLITTTSDRFVVIQGFAGTGKTTMTRTAIDALEYAQSMAEQRIDLVAVAPTHQAVKEMKALGISAQTLKSFLIEQAEQPTLTPRSLVLLDESSMVSNRDCEKLVRFIHEAGARCAFLGDISQHQSIESGKPSKLLMQDGTVNVAYMDEIVRQQVAGYKHAVETLVKGDTDKALSQFERLPLVSIERSTDKAYFNALKTSVVEVDRMNKNATIDMAVRDYLSRTPMCRDHTVVIIHENKNREIANKMIRTSLMAEGTLGKEDQPFLRLLSTNYTTAELYYTQTYQDCLKKDERHFLKKDNEYYQIMSVDLSSHVVTLKDKDGKSSIFLPEKDTQDWKLELFKILPGQVSVGEKIHFKKSDKNIGRFANERVEVVSVSEQAFTVKDATDALHVLNKKDMRDCHWDYSYTATSYSIQGSSSPFVIGVADTGNKKTNHFRSFYIMVSRGMRHAMIYTDDRNKLQQQIRMVPDKSSALEALNRISTDIKPRADKTLDEKNKENKPVTLSINHVRDEQALIETKERALTQTIQKHVTLDAKVIVQNLNAQAEKVIESILGKPNAMSTKNDYRYGKKGSLSFCLSGEKRGTWYNFETLEKGNLLHLIQNELGLDFKDGLQYAADLTGDTQIQYVRSVDQKQQEKNQEKPDVKSKTQAYALTIANESIPLSGTLAERYLKDVRGIQNTSGLDIRFHPNVFTDQTEARKNRPALVNVVRDKNHQVVSIEATYLDDKTGNKATMGIKSKKTFGPKNGSGVILNHGSGPDDVTYLTEGVETGLSVRDAVKNERVIASLGKNNMNKIEMELLTHKVVLCLDNDGKSISDDEAIVKIVDRLQQNGKEVIVVMPPTKGDFNDIARNSGTSGVIHALNQSMKVGHGVDNAARMSHEHIRQCLDKISNQIQLKMPETKEKIIDKGKSLQPLEMEI